MPPYLKLPYSVFLGNKKSAATEATAPKIASFNCCDTNHSMVGMMKPAFLPNAVPP